MARSFKSDDSFLRKLAIGAFGTLQVINHLESQGYNPIELERGSTGYKIWKSIKIKRVRVPDVLCLNSGIRIESRAKSRLAITMSHSTADESRSWDYGLNTEDYVALVQSENTSEDPVDIEVSDLVQYIKVGDLKNAYENGHVYEERQKGASEGFESRLTWPASFASGAGKLTTVDDSKIQFERLSDGRTITLQRTKKNEKLTPLVDIGEEFPEGKAIAAVVNVDEYVEAPRDKDADYYAELLNSFSLTERYTAAKALGYLGNENVEELLTDRIQNDEEHIYIRLEAASSLVRRGNKTGYEFIRRVLSEDFLEHKLEAVIILSEIDTSESIEILSNILEDETENPEIRSGAAWSLGEIGRRESTNSLINSFNNVDNIIRIEAVRALAKITDKFPQSILNEFENAHKSERPGIAWALSKRTNWEFSDLIDSIDFNDVDSRHWAAYILGTNEKQEIIDEIEKLKDVDSELYFAVTLLWKLMSSWIYNLEEY